MKKIFVKIKIIFYLREEKFESLDKSDLYIFRYVSYTLFLWSVNISTYYKNCSFDTKCDNRPASQRKVLALLYFGRRPRTGCSTPTTCVYIPDDVSLTPYTFDGQCHEDNNCYARLRGLKTIIANRCTYDWTRIKVRHPESISINRSSIFELSEASRFPLNSASRHEVLRRE